MTEIIAGVFTGMVSVAIMIPLVIFIFFLTIAVLAGIVYGLFSLAMWIWFDVFRR